MKSKKKVEVIKKFKIYKQIDELNQEKQKFLKIELDLQKQLRKIYEYKLKNTGAIQILEKLLGNKSNGR